MIYTQNISFVYPFSGHKDDSTQSYAQFLELLDQMVVLFFIFRGTAVLFSIAGADFTTNHAQGFQFLHLLTNICYFLFL